MPDPAGRLVRSLDARAGQASEAWDGRDAAGLRVASGVYLARFEDGARLRTCRVVVLR